VLKEIRPMRHNGAPDNTKTTQMIVQNNDNIFVMSQIVSLRVELGPE
jgi:hypothetical protein